MRSDVAPPAFAQAVLTLILDSRDRDAVSGDLLEQYRDEVLPLRGQRSANRWYIAQVARALFRSTWIWAVLFAAAFVGRTLYDWMVPTHDFLRRSEFTTVVAVGLVAGVSLTRAWSTRSIIAGPLAAVGMMVTAAVLNVVASAIVLAVWHNPAVLQAAHDSGGIGEVFVLPFMGVLPAMILGTISGVVGRSAAAIFR